MSAEVLDPADFPAVQAPAVPVEFTAGQRRYLTVRRFLEFWLALGGLVVLAPLMGVLSLAIMKDLGRPVLFTQDRVTTDGRIFRLRKFRSMKAKDPARGLVRDVDRLTPFGEFLRASSLDELPSLLNILRGDMSIVGPRPLTIDYLGRFDALQMSRHAVPAGLTGLAQVNGRNLVGWDDRFEYDRTYVEHLGPALDLHILARTVGLVVRRHGVADGAGPTMTDFPGPMRHPALEFTGLGNGAGTGDARGFHCRDAAGRIVLAGIARARDEILDLEATLPDPAADPGSLADALALLLAHVRAEKRDWASFDRATVPAPLAALLPLHGFRAVERDGNAHLIAYLGLRS